MSWTKAALARLAAEVREKELEANPYQRICPYDLADLYGVAVYTLQDLAESGCPPEAIEFFASARPEAWSAALVPNGTAQFIVENNAHSPQRRRSNIAHEMAHLLLEHKFDRILFTNGKRGCANPASKEMEGQAAELSGELLVPGAGARRAAAYGRSDDQVADQFDVSTEFARWRMNVTGARRIASRAARKRSR
jgi:IrrE N-terminal-like domain